MSTASSHSAPTTVMDRLAAALAAGAPVTDAHDVAAARVVAHLRSDGHDVGSLLTGGAGAKVQWGIEVTDPRSGDFGNVLGYGSLEAARRDATDDSDIVVTRHVYQRTFEDRTVVTVEEPWGPVGD